MRIGELHQATGVAIETIRFYEKEGVLPAPARTDSGYRIYGSAHLERLSFVRHCRALDMPLAEIKQILKFVAHPEADCGDINRLIDEQLARVRVRLKSMRALEKQLSQLRVHCEAGTTAAECGILHGLVAAAQGEPVRATQKHLKAEARLNADQVHDVARRNTQQTAFTIRSD